MRAAAIAALAAVFLAGHASADNDVVAIDLGWFMNAGGGNIHYDGGFAPWVTSSEARSGSTAHTVTGIDVGGLLSALGYGALSSITVTDTGTNAYGLLSPGADIDLLTLTGVDPDAVMTYDYDGPNLLHRIEPSWSLKWRVAELDSFSGAQVWDWTYLSLGREGSLTATFLEPQQLDEYAPYLQVSEAGSIESFRVSLSAIVPGPGGLGLLAAAAFVTRRRRKR